MRTLLGVPKADLAIGTRVNCIASFAQSLSQGIPERLKIFYDEYLHF